MPRPTHPYVATWRGFVFVAFVVDVFARRIVGWRVSSSLATDFVLDALEQAIYDRGGEPVDGLVHHSDRGTQLGFKGPSQRVRVSLSLSDFEVPLQAFSSRVFFAADC
jgi:putative transposase